MSAARFQAFSQKFWLGLTVAAALSASMLAIPPAAAYTSDQQEACTGDAFRLCSSEIPNVDRITACMYEKRAELSPGCRVFFKSEPQPAVTPVQDTTSAGTSASDKPARKNAVIHALRPKKKRKPVKPDDAS